MSASMARPTKYSPERSAAIIRDIRSGCSFRVASLTNGIDQVTFERWRKRYADFDECVRKAEADAEALMTKVIVKAAAGGEWKAAVEYLKRRRNVDWGDKVTHDVDDEIARLLAQLAGGGQDQT